MSNVKFFFDTADADYISRTWDKLSSTLPADGVAGVTTNPNAFDKVQIHALAPLAQRVNELCALVSEIRGDSAGEIYVQIPNSCMSPKEYSAFAKYLSKLGDGKTKVGMKIPPFRFALELCAELSQHVRLNVTGVADCAQALRSFSYGVQYVSLIPGRMEEVGLDAKAQLSFVQDRKPVPGEVIAGSMRTLVQLDWTCKMNCVPTIGSRVLDLVLKEDAETVRNFFKRDTSALIRQDYPPLTSRQNIDLAVAFFEQMDALGSTAAAEFRATLKN